MVARWTRLLAIASLALAGCSAAPDGGGAPAAGEAKEAMVAAAPDVPSDTPIKVSVPQIAYTYRYGFILPAAAVAGVQDRHLAMCDRLGVGRCHVLAMQRASGGDDVAAGSMTLVVAAGVARRFGDDLARAAAEQGGRRNDSRIEAQDLSKQIVDTDARLRSKQALADRLMSMLQTRSGSVADLVAAEKAVAGVQEEIDAARSWLAEARGRVAMSTFELSYGSRDDPVLSPLRRAVDDFGRSFGESLGFLVMLVSGLLPWAIAIGVLLLVVRLVRRRIGRGDVVEE